MLALLGPLASLLGIEVEALRERLQRQAIVWAIIGVFALIFAAFVLVAINNALTLSFGPVIAPLMVAGGALFIALVVFLIAHLRDSSEARRDAEQKRNAELTAILTTAAITALPFLMKSPLLRRIGIPAGGALAAVYFLTRPRGHSDAGEP